MSEILKIIKEHGDLIKDDFIIQDVGRDGNCFYRSLALFYTNDESNYQIFREIIYLSAKARKEELKEFFVEEENDPILVNNELEAYINHINEDKFFAGNIEIYIAATLLNINIGIYERDNINENFRQYSVFIPEKDTEDFIIINFEGRYHYNLLKYNKGKLNQIENDIDYFKNLKIENKTKITNTKFFTGIKENSMSSHYIQLENDENYYKFLYRYLISYENAKIFSKDNEITIDWKKLKYPDNLINENMLQREKDKKKYNYRTKAKNYKIENKILYFTGYAGKNNCKLRIPYITEKFNIISNAHINNGHLGINRTINKIKENGFLWETIISDVKSFINNCASCIYSKKGKTIKTKNIIILTKGPLERIIADGWELDEDLKTITGFSWVIDIIDHFSKFLMSIPVKNNNSENILYCIKQYINYVGQPKIFQSDNGSEYNNALVKNFLNTNNIKQIFSSPRHPQSNGVVEVVHKEVRKNILFNINPLYFLKRLYYSELIRIKLNYEVMNTHGK